MNSIVLGNIIALVASILMVSAGTVKNKKKAILLQTIQIGLFVISNLVLGGITGAIVNLISFIRNYLCYKDRLGMKSKIVIIILSVVFSIKFNNLGIIGYLPVFATVIYTIFMNEKNVIKFKSLLGITTIFWLIYDLIIMSYTSAVFDLCTIIMCIITSISLIKTRKI